MLHLGFSQSSFAGSTPVNRLETFIHEFFFNKLAKLPHNGCFIGKVHRQVRVLPIGKHSQSFKLLLLNINKLLSVNPASFTDF